jgi:phosphomannomutase
MQQTNGVKAGHVAFTPEANKDGIITGKRMLEAIKESYDSEDEIIPPVENIYLSFELFFANMDTKAKIIKHLKQTVEYWRQFVPEDGMPLDVLLNNLKG